MKLQTDNNKKTKLNIGKIIGRTLIIILIFIVFLVALFFSSMAVIIKGPSKTAKNLFVTTCMETSFAKLFPPIYLSDKEIEEIKKANTVVTNTAVTDVNTEFVKPQIKNKDEKPIEIVEITGATYKGKMLIIKDPKRVKLVSPQKYGVDASGEKLDVMMKKYNAVAGINGGGFEDENGGGNGGIPIGIVINNSKFLYGENCGPTNVIGFDNNNVLHVGTMTAKQAKERNLRDAVSFGPSLIVNSTPMKTVGSSGGLNPRTAIGQRADGAVLFLVIDGRQPHSLGATYKDLVDVMTKHGALNAGNLDGGSSSVLYYNDELLSTCASLYGPRKIPNGFIVI